MFFPYYFFAFFGDFRLLRFTGNFGSLLKHGKDLNLSSKRFPNSFNFSHSFSR